MTLAAIVPQGDFDIRPEALLGEKILRLRKERRLSLTTLSAAAGVSASTISRIENGRLSPTYSVLSRLCEALGLHMSDVIAEASHNTALRFAPGCRAVTRGGQGMMHKTPRGGYEFLGTELATKRMEVAIIEPIPDHVGRSLESHAGQEFIYVLEGRLMFYMQHYAPLVLEPGDSVYFDAAAPHAVYAVQGAVRILSLTSHDA